MAKHPRPGLALFGLACLLAGLTGIAALMVAVYGTSDACTAWAMKLGLAGSLLASAFAQVLVLLGGWSLWRAIHGPPTAST
ncbi:MULTISPECIES: hypothetical protein [unclassified Phenylobacterium]|uniref:hypothetical protein n=1 Tax=unclassified Phenylobacterium TaxID=2640670 RepID=UPI00083AB0E7|nr:MULTISPECIES: hypothetical protein [unclassified Phenylobacterium]